MRVMIIVLGVPLAVAIIGFLAVALGSDHDPGVVFPWQFVALLVAVATGAAALLITLIVLGLRWLL